MRLEGKSVVDPPRFNVRVQDRPPPVVGFLQLGSKTLNTNLAVVYETTAHHP